MHRLAAGNSRGRSKMDSLGMGFLFKDRSEIKIVRPIRKVEFRLLDLDESVTVGEIVEAVMARGSAQSGDIRVGPLKPGKIGLNRVWSDYICRLQKDGGLRIH